MIGKLFFDASNAIRYHQDFHVGVGLPHDIVFSVEELPSGSVTLRGPCHGGEPYGNGAIYVHGEDARIILASIPSRTVTG